jgi:hypothetical protein
MRFDAVMTGKMAGLFDHPHHGLGLTSGVASIASFGDQELEAALEESFEAFGRVPGLQLRRAAEITESYCV